MPFITDDKPQGFITYDKPQGFISDDKPQGLGQNLTQSNSLPDRMSQLGQKLMLPLEKAGTSIINLPMGAGDVSGSLDTISMEEPSKGVPIAQPGVPLVNIPHLPSGLGFTTQGAAPGPISDFVTGGINKGADILSGLTTPGNLSIAPVAALGGIPLRVAAGLFGTQAALQTPEAVSQAYKTVTDPNKSAMEKGGALAEGVATPAMAVLGARGALHEAQIPSQPGDLKGGKTHQTQTGNDLGSAREVLQKIAENKESPHAPTAQRILDTGRGELLNRRVTVDPNLKTAGAYDKTTKTLSIHPEMAANDFVLAHEIVHALTAEHLNEPGNFLELQGLMELADKKLAGEHGMENVDEFVTEALTNPGFQQRLRQIRAGDRSVFDKLADLAASAVGRSRMKGSLLEKVKGKAEPLLDKPVPQLLKQGTGFSVAPEGRVAKIGELSPQELTEFQRSAQGESRQPDQSSAQRPVNTIAAALARQPAPASPELINDLREVGRKPVNAKEAADTILREEFEKKVNQRWASPKSEYGLGGSLSERQSLRLKAFDEYLKEAKPDELQRLKASIEEVEPKYPYDILFRKKLNTRLGEFEDKQLASGVPMEKFTGDPKDKLFWMGRDGTAHYTNNHERKAKQLLMQMGEPFDETSMGHPYDEVSRRGFIRGVVDHEGTLMISDGVPNAKQMSEVKNWGIENQKRVVVNGREIYTPDKKLESGVPFKDSPVFDKVAARRATGEPFTQEGKLYSGVPLSIDEPKLRDVFKTYLAASNSRERASALLDAADNKARIEGRQKGNRIRVAFPDKVDQDAITFIAEAGGDKAELQQFESMVKGKDPRAEAAITRGLQQFVKLQPQGVELQRQIEVQRQAELAKGIHTDFLANYMKHAYDMQDQGMFDIGNGGVGVSTSFLKPRDYPNYAVAIAVGERPKTLNSADLLESRIAAGQKLMNRYVWRDQLKTLKAPDGQAFAADLIEKKKGFMAAPRGYVKMELAPGVYTAIHQEFQPLISALTGDSFVRNSKVGSAALAVELGIKHGMLAFDSYHMFRMAGRQLPLTGSVSYKKGLSLMEYDKPTLQRMVKNGEIDKEAGDWVEKNRPTMDLLVKNGLNVGRLVDPIYAKLRHELKIGGVDINVPGRFNKFVFDKLTRGITVETALSEFDRIKKSHPEWSDTQVASDVAKQMNVRFGNLGRQGILKSASARDVAQLLFLAPSWAESMVQSEARGYKQLAQVPVDALRGKGLRVGTAGKGMAGAVTALFVANQVINMLTQGKPTWENEEGHKLDALLPGGFWFSPLNTEAELTHEVHRYGKNEEGIGKLEGPVGRIVLNKLSPPARAIRTMVEGRDYSGAKLDGTDRLKESLKSLIPVPLPAAGFMSELPKQTGRQLYSTMGLRVEPNYRQHEEDLEKVVGKKFEDMDFMDRVKGEYVLDKSRKPLDSKAQDRMEQRGNELAIERRKKMTESLSRATQGWMESRGLRISEYRNEIDLPKKLTGADKEIRVRMTEREAKRFNELFKENFEKQLAPLKPAFAAMDDDKRKTQFAKFQTEVRELSKAQMIDEETRSRIDPVKKKKFSLFNE